MSSNVLFVTGDATNNTLAGLLRFWVPGMPTSSVVINGMGGIDTIDFSTFQTNSATLDDGVYVDLASGFASGSWLYSGPYVTGSVVVTGYATLVSMENVLGSDFDDILFGDANDDLIRGGGADDIIFGRGGVDTLDGGDGRD